MTQEDYQRIEHAIHYINEHYQEQPSLEIIAQAISLSPFHFQKLFKNWAGVSPKKFLQYIHVLHAKKLLQQDWSLLETSLALGMSGPSRLHDLFISIEAMTPDEYRHGGKNLTIEYTNGPTCLGNIMIASTKKGICYLSFIEQSESSFKQAIQSLQKKFYNATFHEKTNEQHQQALACFNAHTNSVSHIKTHVFGTPFQLQVWQALLKIPMGALRSYQHIAEAIQNPKATRAVGSAIGSNPIAYLIPCHRVIRQTGVIGEYFFGTDKKTALIGYESSLIYGEK